MKKRKLMIPIILASVLMSNTTAFAGIEDFQFYISNTGQYFNPNLYGGGNNKSYAGQAWSVKVNSISFSNGKTGAGMAYILYRGSKKASAVCWVPSVQAKKGYWGSNDGAAGYTYYLYGRMDDDLSGSCVSSGYWNSDTIGSWF